PGDRLGHVLRREPARGDQPRPRAAEPLQLGRDLGPRKPRPGPARRLRAPAVHEDSVDDVAIAGHGRRELRARPRPHRLPDAPRPGLLTRAAYSADSDPWSWSTSSPSRSATATSSSRGA